MKEFFLGILRRRLLRIVFMALAIPLQLILFYGFNKGSERSFKEYHKESGLPIGFFTFVFVVTPVCLYFAMKSHTNG